MLIWYHGIAMGLLFPYIQKVQTFHVWCYNCWFYPNCWFTVKYRPKLNFLPKKFKFHQVFLLIKEGNDISNIHFKIQDHTMKTFFKIVISNIARLHQPPTLWLWRLTLPPGKVVPPTFFHQNDHKGYKRDYLGALGHFI